MNTYSGQDLTLRGLIESVRRPSLPSQQVTARYAPKHIPVVGFHVYGEMRFHEALSAPENLKDSERCLRAIYAATILGEECVKTEGGELLEAQGEKLHFLIPAATADGASRGKVVRFAAAFTQAVYKIVREIAGEGWGGFSMAAEHGLSIILTTESGSVISLGPAANNPAKRLSQGVPAGTISIWNGSRWEEEKVLDREALDEADRGTFERFSGFASRAVQQLQNRRLEVSQLPPSGFRTQFPGREEAPLAMYGHVVRADL